MVCWRTESKRDLQDGGMAWHPCWATVAGESDRSEEDWKAHLSETSPRDTPGWRCARMGEKVNLSMRMLG
jgi:hypothetical protein